MKNISIIMFFAILILKSNFVFADDEFKDWRSPYSPYISNEDCSTSTSATVQCLKKSAEYSNNFLINLIKSNIKLINKDQINDFKKINQLWLQFRDGSCEFDSASSGASSKVIHFLACQIAYNEARIELLSKYFYCKNGNCTNDFHLYFLIQTNKD